MGGLNRSKRAYLETKSGDIVPLVAQPMTEYLRGANDKG